MSACCPGSPTTHVVPVLSPARLTCSTPGGTGESCCPASRTLDDSNAGAGNRSVALAIDQLTEEVSLKINRNGDTMTGPLFLYADPVAPLESVTKQYVDNLAFEGNAGAAVAVDANVVHGAEEDYALVQHNLGTRDVIVELWATYGGVREQVVARITSESENVVRVWLAPALLNTIRAVITATGGGPAALEALGAVRTGMRQWPNGRRLRFSR